MFPVLDFLLKGGILVWPILCCSLIGTAIFFERLLTLRGARDREGIGARFFSLLAEGRTTGARRLLAGVRAAKRRRSSVELLLAEAFSLPRSDRETMETVLAHAVGREIEYLGRRLGVLAICGNISPLLGLLGTVFGMIKAFMAVESLGGRVNAAVLAGGIWEAMLTTAFGLLVAIPLIIFHGYLEGRLAAAQTELEEVAVTVLKYWPLAADRGDGHAADSEEEAERDIDPFDRSH